MPPMFSIGKGDCTRHVHYAAIAIADNHDGGTKRIEADCLLFKSTIPTAHENKLPEILEHNIETNKSFCEGT